MEQHVYPDVIIREDEVNIYLSALVMQTGYQDVDDPMAAVEDTPFILSDIYSKEIEALTREAYPMEYALFGFGHYQYTRRFMRRARAPFLSKLHES